MVLLTHIVLFSYLFAVLVAVIINYGNRKRGLKGIPFIQCFSPVKIFSVVAGYVFKFIFPNHIFEQYVLRFYDEDCYPCIKSGVCIGGKTCGYKCACGCDVNAKMWSPLEKDSADNWDRIIWSRKKYNELRKEIPVKIIIKYGG